MEQKTIGKFLSALRKAKGYTQQQVADILLVSNKTVSKWECDDGYPEITMLPVIAELYGVSVDEILKGKIIDKISAKNTAGKTQERMKLLIDRTNLKFKNLTYIFTSLSGSGAFLSFIFSYYFHSHTLVYTNILIFALIISSVIILAIGSNNYLAALKSDETEAAIRYKARRKVNFWISYEVYAILAAFTGMIYEEVYIIDNWGFPLVMLILSLIAAIIVKSILNNKTCHSFQIKNYK